MTVNDERSNARMLLDAYELVDIVINRYLDIVQRYGEKELNAKSDNERDIAIRHQEEHDFRLKPLSDIKIGLLRLIALELDEGMGNISWVEKDKIRK